MSAAVNDDRPYADLTPQEQAERRRAAARKAAATRAKKRREAEQAARAATQAPVQSRSSQGPQQQAFPAPAVSVHGLHTESVVIPADTAMRLESAAVAPSIPPAAPGTEGSAAQPDVQHGAIAEPRVETSVQPSASPSEPDRTAAEPGVGSAPEVAATTLSIDPHAPALDIAGLSKQFGNVVAVDNVTLEVAPGDAFGIVGPNGAGKTTTILAATGLQRPDAGTVKVCGLDLWADRSKAQQILGVVPDRLRSFDRLTGRQLIVHTALLRRIRRRDALERASALLIAFGLDQDADRVVADYSIGMQKTIAIATALVHNPRVVVLDEPFESIDPASTDRIVGVLDGYRARGGTVVLSSHDMALVQRTCDSVAVIQNGKLLAVGTMDQVRGGQSLEERFKQLVGVQQEDLAWLSPSQG